VPCHRIDVIESKRGDGTFPDSFCGNSEHQKWVETGKNDTKTWNDTPPGDIISQLAAGAVRTDSIWEMWNDMINPPKQRHPGVDTPGSPVGCGSRSPTSSTNCKSVSSVVPLRSRSGASARAVRPPPPWLFSVTLCVLCGKKSYTPIGCEAGRRRLFYLGGAWKRRCSSPSTPLSSACNSVVQRTRRVLGVDIT
jgi:hypothetical protein